MNRQHRHLLWITSLTTLIFAGCSQTFQEQCPIPPALDMSAISSVRSAILSGGPQTALALPNPMDAAGASGTQALGLMSQLESPMGLSDLASPLRLENAFLKVRVHTIQDDPSLLAQPNAQGNFDFQFSDPHYSEAMAYYSVTAIQHYVEALGFPPVKTRPLYVMVRAQDSSNPNDVNAYYTHNYLSPNLPRTIKLFGDTQYAPGEDRDMYWHEFGHLLNESVSHEVGIDYAGDMGAVYTEAAGLHECLADYLAESVGNKGYIGRWIAMNFSDTTPGAPLRSAVPQNDEFNTFKSVSVNDGQGNLPERYHLGQWCTRVLWDIRSHFVQEDSQNGAIASDRLIYSAVSLLQRDTSVSQFHDALVLADKQLSCGSHASVIENAFGSRGFTTNVATLSSPLTLQATPVGVDESGAQPTQAPIGPGVQVVFHLVISNPNAQVARNVRVYLQSNQPLFQPIIYMQGLGDLAPGQTIEIGGNSPITLDYSPSGQIDPSAHGQRLNYTLTVKAENAADTNFSGGLTP